jgi:multimeric flavodoxin WrbA
MRVVAFNGSARRDGNTALLVAGAFAPLQAAGIETELVQLAGHEFVGCCDCGTCGQTRDGRCAQDDDGFVNECIDRMVAADGIIIASPVYFANCTATTQALIERAGYATRKSGHLLARKVGAAVVAVRRAGAMHAFDSINHFFQINQMIVVGSSYWNIGVGRDVGDVTADDEGMQTMQTLGENMAWLLQRVASGE